LIFQLSRVACASKAFVSIAGPRQNAFATVMRTAVDVNNLPLFEGNV